MNRIIGSLRCLSKSLNFMVWNKNIPNKGSWSIDLIQLLKNVTLKFLEVKKAHMILVNMKEYRSQLAKYWNARLDQRVHFLEHMFSFLSFKPVNRAYSFSQFGEPNDLVLYCTLKFLIINIENLYASAFQIKDK